MVDLFSERQLKARKRHVCHLCGRPILPGAEYIRAKWFDDGFREVARHVHCDVLLNAIAPELSDQSEFTEDEVTEILRDTCAELHNNGKCSDDDYNTCVDADCYGCYLVQLARIASPVILRAAEKSVRENMEDD